MAAANAYMASQIALDKNELTILTAAIWWLFTLISVERKNLDTSGPFRYCS